MHALAAIKIDTAVNSVSVALELEKIVFATQST